MKKLMRRSIEYNSIHLGTMLTNAGAFHAVGHELLLGSMVLTTRSQNDDLGTLVVGATNLCLAAELYLKALIVRGRKNVPMTHDLLRLWRNLDDGMKDRIAARYVASLCRIPPHVPALLPKKADGGFRIERAFVLTVRLTTRRGSTERYQVERVLRFHCIGFETFRYLRDFNPENWMDVRDGQRETRVMGIIPSLLSNLCDCLHEAAHAE